MTPALVRRPLVAGRDGLAASNPDGAAIAPISTGSKIELSLLAGSAVPASLRHVKEQALRHPVPSSDLAHHRPGISVSSTIRDFSSVPHRRRRSIPRTFPSISA